MPYSLMIEQSVIDDRRYRIFSERLLDHLISVHPSLLHLNILALFLQIAFQVLEPLVLTSEI